jgi:hypothetical protein
MTDEENAETMGQKFLKQYPNAPEEKESNGGYSLSRKNVLTRNEYRTHQKTQISLMRKKYQEELKKAKEKLRYERGIRKYNNTRTGKVSSVITRGYNIARSRGGVAGALYRNVSPERRAELMQVAKARLMQKQIQKNEFDWMFSNFSNPQFNVTHNLEREISSFGGEANIGDRMSNVVGGDAFAFANVLQRSSLNPVRNIEMETMKFANLQHINPVLNINKEVNIFSNLLS